MKSIFTLLFFSLLFSSLSFAQKDTSCSRRAGVYKNYSDFILNNFSDSICLNNKGDNIRLGNNSVIKMSSSAGDKKTYPLGEIFAYCDGKDKYRYFYDDKNEGGLLGYFKIENEKGIIIYSQWNLHGGTTYYFSKDFESPVKTLSKLNIERDYTNEDFIKEIKGLKELNKKRESALQLSSLYNKYYPAIK